MHDENLFVMQELAQLQGSHQTLEQQLDQTRTKLTQDIQQSQKDLNFLQADMEKVTFLLHLDFPSFISFYNHK